MNAELEKKIKVLSQTLTGVLRKITKNFSHDSWNSSRTQSSAATHREKSSKILGYP
jgi:hypothetical protein